MSDLGQTDKVCKYYQSGFCKFGVYCRKRHESETCKYKNQCNNKECPKRHPKICRNFVRYGTCRWNADCAYMHDTESKHAKVDELEKEMELMKKEINLLRENMIEIMKTLDSLEPRRAVQHESVNEDELICSKCDFRCKKEITLQKHTNTTHACGDDQQCKDKDNIKDISVEEVMDKICHNALKVKEKASTYSPTSEKNKSESSVEGLIKCNICDYKCKRTTTLEKHKNTKHNQEKEVCKQCKHLFNSSIELLQHTAEVHHIEEVNYVQRKADKEIEMENDEDNYDSNCSECREERNASNNTTKCTLCAIMSYVPLGKE